MYEHIEIDMFMLNVFSIAMLLLCVCIFRNMFLWFGTLSEMTE